MTDQIKKRAGGYLNTAYNKAVYSALVGASVDFLFGLLAEFGVDVSGDLQNKTLILAMALITWLVPNKNSNDGGEPNMSKVSNFILPVVLAIGFALTLGGCAKNVDPVDITQNVSDTMRGLTVGSLKLLDRHVPEQVEPTKEDFMEVVAQGTKYVDGEASVRDFADTLHGVFDRLNARFFLITDGEYLDVVLILYGTATGWADTFLVDQTLSENVRDYIEAVVKGIETGVADYEIETLGEPAGEGGDA